MDGRNFCEPGSKTAFSDYFHLKVFPLGFDLDTIEYAVVLVNFDCWPEGSQVGGGL